MAVSNPPFSVDVLNKYAQGSNKAQTMTDDQLISTLNDDNASDIDKRSALNEYRERLGKKVHVDGTATEDEKRAYEMLGKLPGGSLSSSDLKQLGSIMGVKVDSLASLVANDKNPDGSEIR